MARVSLMCFCIVVSGRRIGLIAWQKTDEGFARLYDPTTPEVSAERFCVTLAGAIADAVMCFLE